MENSKSKSKEYVVNTIILFIGKFTTQFMSFLLLPLYTHYLLTDDYGFVDIIQTYESLFIPIFTLRLDSAVFRYLIDERENFDGQKKIVNTSLFLLIIEILIFILIFGILNLFIDLKYALYILFNIPAIMISNVLLQLIRGLGKNKDYSIACIITGISTLVANMILIIGFKYNAGSILISSTIANILCIIYLVLKIHLPKYIKIKYIHKKTLKEMLNYSLPMIPNSMSWWIVNVSDRTLISWFIGVAANGIYTVSCKFANILNSIFSIFNMSWQETASLHIEDDDRDIFFSNMINKILSLFINISLVILTFLPILFNFIIGEEYSDSYKYIPIILFANIFNVFINLIGGIYLAKKQTRKLASTTIISAIINIFVNLAFIKKFELYAASVSTVIAYVGTVIYRYVDVQKYVKFNLNLKKFMIGMVIFTIITLCYYINKVSTNIISIVICLIYVYISSKYLIKELFFLVKKKIKK